MESNIDMFSGMNKVETAIARLKNFEPPEGYYLAFSGGKDSVVLLEIAKRADVKFDAHYSITTIDPPEVVQFIKTFPEVSMDHPPETFCQMMQYHGLPRRQGRWCCEQLKERGGSGRIVLTGIRWAESKGKTSRSHRSLVETCYKDTTKRMVHPIIDWQQDEIWEYIRLENIRYCKLYDEGAKRKGYGEGDFKRLGCVLCPMVRDIDRQFIRWPKTVEAIRRAVYRYWERKTPGGQKFPDAESLWLWWLDRDAKHNIEPLQQMMFDSIGIDDV